MTQASCRKRAAESWDDWWEANRELRRSKRRRTAWLRDKEVAWWDAKAQKVQDQADQGDAFGVFATFKVVIFFSLTTGGFGDPKDPKFQKIPLKIGGNQRGDFLIAYSRALFLEAVLGAFTFNVGYRDFARTLTAIKL